MKATPGQPGSASCPPRPRGHPTGTVFMQEKEVSPQVPRWQGVPDVLIRKGSKSQNDGKKELVSACVVLGGGTRAWVVGLSLLCRLHLFGLDFLLVTCSHSFCYEV